MTSGRINLNEISVKSPCTVPWGKMTGDERSRFCGQCKLNVYNLEGMTRAEAEDLLGTSEGRVCVRFFRRADGTVMTKDCSPVRAARARRALAYSAAVVVVMFVQAMSWLAKRGGWPEEFAANQSSERARTSIGYRRIPAVAKAVDWAQQQVKQPPTKMGKFATMGMRAEMGDFMPAPLPVVVTTTAPMPGGETGVDE